MPEQPKVTVVVSEPGLRERVRSLLAAEDVEVEFVDGRGGDLEMGHLETDLVVVGERFVEELLDDAPEDMGVIVVADDANDQERANLVASGANAVLDADAATLGEDLAVFAEAEVEGGLDGPEVGGAGAEPKLADFQSRSPRMRDFLDLVQRVADSDTSLLITGETGVGKERLARAVHAASARRDGPFVAVNCGALPENLLESELFGHQKGAFTGASAARKGRFELASGGTIFLDEIGEMPPHLQVNLLTVLQRLEVHRLGGEEPVSVDVRVMAATNRDLAADVADGKFREDLFFRLKVVALEIPPLRERPEDLPELIGGFIRHFRERSSGKLEGVSEDAMRALASYDWPGNVREVVNIVERATLLGRGKLITLADLPAEITRLPAPVTTGATADAAREDERAGGLPEDLVDLPLADARRRVLAEFERTYLVAQLKRTEGAVGETAERAGINPRTLYQKMKQYGLDKSDFR